MAYLKTIYEPNGEIFTPIDYYTCDITGEVICECEGWYGNDKVQISENGLMILIDKLFKRAPVPPEWILSDFEHKYVHKKKPSRYISQKTRKAVFEKYNYTCAKCGSKKNLEIDHIIPVSKQGGNEFENLQVLCKTCNLKKSNKI